MYLSVMGDNCSIMYNDYELTMNYDMISSLGKGWFQIDRYDSLLFETCVNNVRNMFGIIMTR